MSQSLGGVLGRAGGGFLFLNKKNLTLQHSSAADQKSSCLEQLLSSSPLHIVPFKQSVFRNKILVGKEASLVLV